MNRNHILRAVRLGPLPDNSIFNPSMTALLENPVDGWNETGSDASESGHPAPSIEPVVSAAPLPSADSIDITLEGARVSRVTTRSERSRFLVLSDAYDPGWRARLDGKPASIQRCNFMFMGIALPPGEHEVELDYRPRTLIIAKVVTIFAAAVSLGLAFLRGRTTDPPGPSRGEPPAKT
jgi:hypothetical protein